MSLGQTLHGKKWFLSLTGEIQIVKSLVALTFCRDFSLVYEPEMWIGTGIDAAIASNLSIRGRSDAGAENQAQSAVLMSSSRLFLIRFNPSNVLL